MKISVIIPVYNAEEYLDECITSVLNQCYTDFELLLIDDGSTDRSGEICDGFAIKDSRVTVFHKKNGGVSSARNLGLKNASGEWVTFVDSDDFISENYFQPTLDFSEQDYIIVNSNEIIGTEKKEFRCYQLKKILLDDFFNNYNLFKDFSTPWGKFYKKSIIDKNNILFDEDLDLGEDVIFNLSFLINCKNIGLSNVTEYNYRRETGGLSQKGKDVKYLRNLYNLLYNKLKTYSNNPNFISNHISYSASVYFRAILNSNLKVNDKRNFLLKLIKRHKKHIMLSMEKERLHLIPVKWLIKYELINFTIWLGSLNKK